MTVKRKLRQHIEVLRQRKKDKKRTFRLQALPAEVRVQIFEQFALSSTIYDPITNWDSQVALLWTSKQVRHEAYPIMGTMATFVGHVEDWDFQPLLRMMEQMRQIKFDSNPGLERNMSLRVFLKPVELEAQYTTQLEYWLERCDSILDIDRTYIVSQADQERLKWKSRTGFLWKIDVPMLEEIRSKETRVVAQRDLDGIISAYQEESVRVDMAQTWYQKEEEEEGSPPQTECSYVVSGVLLSIDPKSATDDMNIRLPTSKIATQSTAMWMITIMPPPTMPSRTKLTWRRN